MDKHRVRKVILAMAKQLQEYSDNEFVVASVDGEKFGDAIVDIMTEAELLVADTNTHEYYIDEIYKVSGSDDMYTAVISTKSHGSCVEVHGSISAIKERAIDVLSGLNGWYYGHSK